MHTCLGRRVSPQFLAWHTECHVGLQDGRRIQYCVLHIPVSQNQMSTSQDFAWCEGDESLEARQVKVQFMFSFACIASLRYLSKAIGAGLGPSKMHMSSKMSSKDAQTPLRPLTFHTF